MKEIKIKYHYDNVQKISKIEQGDWIDLRAAKTYNLYPGKYYSIDLGVSVKLPKGYEAHIVPRSSSFRNWGFLQVNSMAIIDESFCGPNDIWRLPIYATREAVIKCNERICQFRILPKMPDIKLTEIKELYDKDRGGFGTTNKI